MIQFIQSNSETIVNLAVIISFIGSLLFWSHRKLRADMNEYKSDMKAINSKIDATNTRIDAMGQRIDAMGQRIDHTYNLILDMMKEMKGFSNKQS